MQFLTDYVTASATTLFNNSTGKGGVGSGGFYFEWNDEWIKAGWSHSHIGGLQGNHIAQKDPFPGCYNDEAWYGLSRDEPVDRAYKWPGDGNAFPLRPPDRRIARPALDAIKAVWATE
jgi:hypothetical protein